MTRGDGRPSVAERLRIRAGSYSGQTSSLAPGYVQGNLVVLPGEFADDFLRFCQRNPKPCPLIAVSDSGDFRLPALGDDLDIRTDIPRYRVWKDGVLQREPTDIVDLWTDDLVSFVLGCSFSFEEALLDADIEVRHIACGSNVPMYRTRVACHSAGVFRGPLVVSMRPLTPADAIKAIQITARFPNVHGAPVHLGFPQALGIDDLNRPDYGDAVPVREGELPVFWACGVTPQAVVEQARPPLCITHAPGCMLITDLKNSVVSL